MHREVAPVERTTTPVSGALNAAVGTVLRAARFAIVPQAPSDTVEIMARKVVTMRTWDPAMIVLIFRFQRRSRRNHIFPSGAAGSA